MSNELNDFLFQCRARGLSEKTLKGYKNINLAFMKWLNDEKQITDVEEVKKAHIQIYVNGKMDEGRKEKYLNSIIKTVNAFFTFLVEEEYIAKNPVEKVKFLRERKDIIEVYKDDEAMALIKAFDNVDYLSIRNKTMIALQLDTGIRCSETINIKIPHIIDDRILIHGKGKKMRTVPISFEMAKLLRKYLKSKKNYMTTNDQGEYLFVSRTGLPLTVEAIEQIYKRAGRIAEIERSIRISPHTSRHYYAVKMLEHNDIYTVSKLLGHSSVSITEIYLRSVTSDKVINLGRITSPLTSMKIKKI